MAIESISILVLEVEEELGHRITQLVSEISSDTESIQVSWVRSAAEALAQLQQRPFSLILLGLPLADTIVTGFNVLRQMRQIKPSVPVVALIKQGMMGLGMQAVEFGALAFFSSSHLTPGMLRRIVAKAAEQRLVWQEAETEGILSRITLDPLPVYVVILDALGQITAVNQEWVQLAATTDNPLITQAKLGIDFPLLNRQMHYPLIAKGVEDVLDGNKIKLMIEYPWQESKRLVWYLIYVTPLRWPQGGAVVTFQEITETITQQIRLSTYEIEVSDLKSNFATTVHELRTPLTNIHLYLDLIKRQANPERQLYYLSIVKREAVRLQHYVNDILSLASLDEKENEQKFIQFDLTFMVQHVVTVQQPVAANKGLELTLIGDSSSFLVNGNPRQLVRVITNLVANAIRYTEVGFVQVELNTVSHGNCLKVTDSGIGISPEALPHIFEQFFRSPHAQQISDAGTGLGLAIVQKIVHNHHGSVTVTSKVDEGSTFQVWLPEIEPTETYIPNATTMIDASVAKT